ncbi:MAG: hypothetical protein CMQ17_13365 [Gammaproteobacteria bacterium]|jgi:hypothetical protein|nr:hypothetical protein [Gammaproteobacteria bacterium]|tara:strand:- start:332 stop:511 length:180 start_codon:yes stop_codon:yes gene_type:complete
MKVFVDIYPRRMPPRQYRKIAMSYYEAGAQTDWLSRIPTDDTPGRVSGPLSSVLVIVII